MITKQFYYVKNKDKHQVLQRTRKSKRTNLRLRNQDQRKLEGVQGRGIKKKIVFPDSSLETLIVPNMLYRCSLVPMKNGNGFIALSAKPVRFKATIVTSCNKRGFKVEVKFGNKVIEYDPKSPERKRNDIAYISDNLRKRLDLENAPMVAEDFINNACIVLRLYEQSLRNV